MIGDRAGDELQQELAKVLALVSNPVQGVLSLLRWQRQSSRAQSPSESSSIQDLLLGDKSLRLKIAHFGSAVSGTERTSLISELQFCLGSSLNKNRSIHRRAPLIQKISLHSNKKIRYEVDDICNKRSKFSKGSAEDSVRRNSGGCNSRNPNGISRSSSFKPYSESALWSTQQHFYAARGADAWECGEVPSLISSNSFVADMYVKMIVDVMLKFDRKRRFDVKKIGNSSYIEAGNRNPEDSKLRVAVVEVGAGHGLLSLLLARKFREVMHQSMSYLFDPDCHCGDIENPDEDRSSRNFSSFFDVTVIGTDFHSSVFKDLLLLPWTRRLCEDGLLDFAVCAAADLSGSCHLNHSVEARPVSQHAKGGLQLLYSGKQSSDHQWDLMVVVANYAFDSFPTDLVASYTDGASGSQPIVFEVGVTDPGPADSTGTSTDEPHTQHQPSKAKRRLEKERLMARKVSLEGSATVPKVLVDYITSAAQGSPESLGSKSGVYAIPSAGIRIMSLLKEAFPCPSGATNTIALERGNLMSCEDPGPLERMTVLIVGDCVVAEDDALWQSKEFSQLDLGSDSGSQIEFPIPWFDPPLISPQPTVCAVPVSLTSLDYAFGVAFGSVKSTGTGACSGCGSGSGSSDSSGSSGTSSSGPMLSYLRGSTPLCGSSFSVLMYTSPDIPKTLCNSCGVRSPDLEGREGYSPSVCPPFGPHDYCTIREFLLGDYRVNKSSRLSQDTVRDKDLGPGHSIESACPLNRMTHQKNFLPRIVAEHFSLNFLWNFIMKIGCVDSQLFVDLRWVVLRAVLRLTTTARAVPAATRKASPRHMEGPEEKEGTVRVDPQWQSSTERGTETEIEARTKTDGRTETTTETGTEAGTETETETEIVSEVLQEVMKWCDAAVACVRYHSCCSIEAVLRIRSKVSHWLLALCSALKKQIAPREDHLYTAMAMSVGEKGPPRSHLDAELMRGSVYALQSLLSLHCAAELSEGIGLDPSREVRALASAFLNNVTVPVPSCLWRCSSNDLTQATRPAPLSFIPSSDGSKGPQLMPPPLCIHCLCEGEAASCVIALMTLDRIATHSETRIPEQSTDQKCSSQAIHSSILLLCRHVAAVLLAKHAKKRATENMDQNGSEKDKGKDKDIASEKKLIRKMNRIIDLHIDNTDSNVPYDNFSSPPSTL